MCGIVGYTGAQQVAPLLTQGLSKLEYRGYDSAGIAVACNGGAGADQIEMRRALGKLENLKSSLRGAPLAGKNGIGHTRWATHGVPSEINSHPHADNSGQVYVVHNGIIENYAMLRAELESEGIVFHSQTDTEVLPNLINREYARNGGDFPGAVRAALDGVRGAYALAVLHREHPETLVAVRQTAPLVVGRGRGENFVASDPLAILQWTRDIIFLDDRQMAVVTPDAVEVRDLSTRAKHRGRDRNRRVERAKFGKRHLAALYAQGDSRATRSHRTAFASLRARRQDDFVRAFGLNRRRFARRAAHFHSGVRHIVARRFDRQIAHRTFGPHFGRCRYEFGVSLSQRRRAHAGRDSGRRHFGFGDLAIGRNRRHFGGRAGGARTRLESDFHRQYARQFHCARQRRRDLHAGRAGNLGRLDQSLHRTNRRVVSVFALFGARFWAKSTKRAWNAA